MKKIYYLLFAYLIVLSVNVKVFSQEPTGDEQTKTESDEGKDNNFSISVTGGSNMIQKGKKPAESLPYLAPAFSYSHSSGFGAGIGANYAKGTKKWAFDNVSANVGYNKSIGDHLSLGAGYSYAHYMSSNQIASTESNLATLTSSWNNEIVTPSLGVSYAFGQASDFTINAGLSHDFSFDGVLGESDNLSIPIAINAAVGTSNYYQEYIKRNPNKIKAKKKATAVTAQDVNTGFALSYIVLESGLSYTIKKITFSTAGSYILMTSDSSTIELDNSPVFTFTVSYSF